MFAKGWTIIVSVAKSQIKGKKLREGTGLIQRQYNAILLLQDETKLKLSLPSDLVLEDSPNHLKNPQACLQSKLTLVLARLSTTDKLSLIHTPRET